MAAVNPHPEGIVSMPTCVAGTCEPRRFAPGETPEPCPQRGSQYNSHAVETVETSSPTTTQHCLAISEYRAQRPTAERGVPGGRQAWPEVRIVGIVRVLAARHPDGHKAERWVNHVSVCCGHTLGREQLIGSNNLATERV